MCDLLSVFTAAPPMSPMKEGCASDTPSAEKFIDPEKDAADNDADNDADNAADNDADNGGESDVSAVTEIILTSTIILSSENALKISVYKLS